MQVIKTTLTTKRTEKYLYFYAKKIIPNNELKILKKHGYSAPLLTIGKWQLGYKFCFNSASVNINDEDELEEYIDEYELKKYVDKYELEEYSDDWEDELDFITTINIESFKYWQNLINTGHWTIDDSDGNNYSLEKFTDFVNSKQHGKPELEIIMKYLDNSLESVRVYSESFDEDGYWFV